MASRKGSAFMKAVWERQKYLGQQKKSVHPCLFALDLRAVECNLPTLLVRSLSSLNIFQDEDGAALSAFPEDNGKGVLLR